MPRLTLPLLTLGCALLALPIAAETNHPSVEKMLDNARVVQGTLEEVEALGGLRFSGTRKIGRVEERVLGFWQPPNRLRLEFSRRDRGRELHYVETGIAERVWRQEAGVNNGLPQWLPEAQAAQWWEEAPLPGPHGLLAPARDVAYRGKDRFANRPVYLLRAEATAERPGGWLYLDSESFEVLRYSRIAPQNIEAEADGDEDEGGRPARDVALLDTQRAGGALLPTHLELLLDGEAYGEIKIDRWNRIRLEPDLFLPPREPTRWLAQ